VRPPSLGKQFCLRISGEQVELLEGVVVSRPLRPLDSGEIQLIHNTVLEILARVGVVYEADWALDLLAGAGCKVDRGTKKALIPENLVDEAINKAPRTIRLCGRNPKYDFKLEGTKVYFAGGANAIRIVEYYGVGEISVRPATKRDLMNLTILTDALENIHCHLAPVFPQDVPSKGVDRIKCEIVLNYTEKHFYHDAEGYAGALDQLEMASIVMGGEDNLRKRPILSLAPCITSPLTWSEDALGMLKACAERDSPAIISSETITGATAPVTLGGSLTQQCAEILSGFVIGHLLRPGMRTIACTLPSVMDMRTANIVLSSIETGMMSAASAQIFREFYGVPYVGGACVSDSKVPDQQAGYEKALTALYGALGAPNLLHLASGMLDFILSVNPEQIVIDNEILGMVLHGISGIKIDDETLALDAIMKVGPRGQFLSQKHTLRNMPRELYVPKISDRLPRESWEKSGSQDILARAKHKVEQILNTHRPEPLSENVRVRLRQITESATGTG